MTTMEPQAIRCGVCGSESEQMIIGSTSSFGAMDLDTRPPPLKRFNLAQEIQQCPSCGYCATDLESGTPDLAEVVSSPAYRDVETGEQTVAGMCLKAALVAEEGNGSQGSVQQNPKPREGSGFHSLSLDVRGKWVEP